jgi:hypothetical protein
LLEVVEVPLTDYHGDPRQLGRLLGAVYNRKQIIAFSLLPAVLEKRIE